MKTSDFNYHLPEELIANYPLERRSLSRLLVLQDGIKHEYFKDIPKYFETANNNIWKLYDKSNANEDRDQLKAVIGICLTFGSLFLMGLYSNLI